MRRPPPRQRAFDALRTLLYRWAAPMDVAIDEPQRYSINTRYLQKNKKPLHFGAVRISKTYVSFHLKALHINPELAENLSWQLRKRRQGISCFNFNEPDTALFAELKELVKACYEDYVRRGYI